MDQMALSEGTFLQHIYHMSIGMSPFMALYGYKALNFVDLVITSSRVPRIKDLVKQSQEILESLKETL